MLDSVDKKDDKPEPMVSADMCYFLVSSFRDDCERKELKIKALEAEIKRQTKIINEHNLLMRWVKSNETILNT